MIPSVGYGTPMGDVLDPALAAWLADVAGDEVVRIERRTGGASRAGYAVDARRSDGSIAEWWLRADPGFGPQSSTRYSLRREAAVYRALGPTPVRVAELVAVHPDQPAFLMQRVAGESRFARITDADAQRTVARQFVEQLAALHRLEPEALDLPELGAVRPMADLVHEEIDEWERQYLAAGGGVPVISLACAWLRTHVPAADGWPVVLVQGDTGPGNFMFEGDRLVAITDWELAHWGDLHDDLAWIFVRDALEPFPDLDERLAEYERILGVSVDVDRLRYFRVLAQLRATIGTLAGLRTRDQRGEIAWQLIYNTLHTRLLGDSLADVAGITPEPEPSVPVGPGARSWLYDVALGDLHEVIVPALADDFATTRAKGVARLLKYAREADRLGPELEGQERDELGALVGSTVDEVDAGRRAVCEAIGHGSIDATAVLRYCLRQAARDTAVARPAMGVLADRRLRPLDLLDARGGTR